MEKKSIHTEIFDTQTFLNRGFCSVFIFSGTYTTIHFLGFIEKDVPRGAISSCLNQIMATNQMNAGIFMIILTVDSVDMES